ncbi:hypothetical protein TVAG_468160 [Trichomonas vaginalis G3]|uniref:EF-hand domain-containing protein n=1 Tax=Trichomonas vaginalis (strain ATCC PRA-98 / G3) TaxID=412133 RepID=A2E0Q5_TRIV3|nr:hypothetical protein TVAGG3_0073640 [Trichomonas vaginalis G3]EAY13800.1 hypothetical protein TVAG_468160 [Trichomonas vaginalis G3]KAI5542685.1 hypothetical protein TVAGG3_0073640 [Trichomonas vaginalis G3]|eukprot:XP_001326023.1 hypothetical protein [Trichomonas vaginalis G3]
MGNEISATNSIAYYQKEICGGEDEEEDKIPIFKLNKIRLMENHDIEENSIVFLYTLDRDQDGYVNKSDIEKFIRFLQSAQLDPNDCDFGYKCGAYCTETLCKILIDQNKDALKDWVMIAISTSFQVLESDEIKFIDGDAVKRLYDLLQIQQLCGRNFQWVLDMLQRHAEANLKMNLNDPAFDDLVPIDTVISLVQQITNGMIESYSALTKH